VVPCAGSPERGDVSGRALPGLAGRRGGGRAGVTGAPELPLELEDEDDEDDTAGGGARQTIASGSSP